jgi:hypothetical protein
VNTTARLGAYALVLAGSLGAGAAVGSWVGPIDVGGPDPQEIPEVGDPEREDHTGEPGH